MASSTAASLPGYVGSQKSAMEAVLREPRVHHRELRPRQLALDDPLGVRVEVVAGLEVRGQQQDEARVRAWSGLGRS